MDWGDGDYELTAATLTGGADHAIRAAGIVRGGHPMRVLDLGAGTGNAALLAASLGANVVAVEPSERLLSVCGERAAREGLAIERLVGDASAIPLPASSVDAVVSVFAVIFAPDASSSVAEMLRVVRPGGRVVVTSWLPGGAVWEAGSFIRNAYATLRPDEPPRVSPAWGDRVFVADLFASAGATTSFEEGSIRFTAKTPEAWLVEQENHHPMWRSIRAAFADAGRAWDDIHARLLALLTEKSEDAAAFAATSRFLVTTAVKS